MRLGVSGKLICGTFLVVVLAFCGMTFLILTTVQGNHQKLMQAVLAEFENNSRSSAQNLQLVFKQTGERLTGSEEEIGKLGRDLFDTNSKRMLQALVSQIYPLVENFNYESAGNVMVEALKGNREIKWISFVTSGQPKPSDIFTFGEKVADGDKETAMFSWVSPKGSVYLKMDMQVSLAGLQDFIKRVKEGFKGINAKNKEMGDLLEKSGEQSRLQAINAALKVAQSGKRSLIIKIILFTSLALLLACLSLLIFSKKLIVQPISKVIDELNNEAKQLTSVAGQISNASQSLSVGASQQAASLEQTSASLEEMASMTHTNADSARQADTLTGEAARVVENANQSMIELTQSMKEVSHASEETAKIIRTIDEIAFQTNLLALNAAVEAARAGEAGAGFAVVADEVRALAMRAADAAKSTANLIEGTVGKVHEGSALVTTTSEAFTQMAGSTDKVKELVAEIAAASREQAQGVDQVSRAVTEINKVTQEIAANAEQSASVSQELNSQVGQIKGFVEHLTTIVGGSDGIDLQSSNGQGAREMLQAGLATIRQTITRPRRNTKLLAPAQSKGVTLEQIIPLEGRDFKDF